MIHESEDESKRVLPSRINADERYKTLAVVEAAACQGLLVQPLPVGFSEQNVLLSRSLVTDRVGG